MKKMLQVYESSHLKLSHIKSKYNLSYADIIKLMIENINMSKFEKVFEKNKKG